METKFCKFCGEQIDAEAIVCSKCGRQLKVVKESLKTEKKEEKIEFYQNSWFMWLMLIVFAPIGIFLMYKFNNKLSARNKTIITIASCIWFILVIFINNVDSSKEYSIDGETYKITGEYTILEDHIGQSNVEKLIELGITDFTNVPYYFDNKKIELEVDKLRNIIIEFESGKITKVYSKDNHNEIYVSSNELDDTYSYDTGNIVKDNSVARKAEEERIAREQEEAKQRDIEQRTKILSTGVYIVGRDIEKGLYDAIAVSGTGNFVVTGTNELFDLKVNEIFGVGNSFYTPRYNNLNLEIGDEIELSGGVKVKFQAK